MSEVVEQVRALLRGRGVLLVGVGNPLRGDDAVGSLLAGRLVERGLAAIDAETVPENYLGTLLDAPADLVLFLDAVDHGEAPGAVCLGPARILAERCSSTHAPSLLLLARMLEGRGKDVWLLGIQPQATEIAAPLSAAVRTAAGALEEILAEALAPMERAHV
jgi:hydrogenase 3 maturation protease